MVVNLGNFCYNLIEVILMLSFFIDTSSIKLFMSRLLKDNMFDNLELRHLILENIIKYEISGNLNKDYLIEEEISFNFIKWEDIKPTIFDIVKGSQKPKSLKIVFSLDTVNVDKISKNIKSMFLNILYENNEILVTTGTSQKEFSLNKSEDIIWEDMIVKFFKKNDIVIHTD